MEPLKFRLNIQSISDIITNSSSEVFTIYTTMSDSDFREWWSEVLEQLGYTRDEIEGNVTIGGIVYQEGSNEIELSYSGMCNVSDDIGSILRSEFGKNNVIVID